MYIVRNKNPSFHVVRCSCLCLNTMRGSERTLRPGFLTKLIDNTLQTCVDIANEYLQAYNIGADVKPHLFCSLHQCKCAGFTIFLITFVISK